MLQFTCPGGLEGTQLVHGTRSQPAALRPANRCQRMSATGRLPQEYGDAPGQLKFSAACAEDWTVAEDTRLEAEASTRAAALQRWDGPTLDAELRDYVEKKRRAKDGLALKARTKSDYLAAIEAPRVTKGGSKRAAGPLHPIANKPLATLTASDIRATYEAAARRSLRRAEYAMQILRAVLR